MQTAIRWALYILGIEILFLVLLRFGHFSLMPPLAATCMLMGANPQGPFAQPRTVLVAYILVGHLGLLYYVFWSHNLFCLLVMTLLAVALMGAVSCIHPPAIAILFLLARSANPFQDYLLMIVFVLGIVGFHYTAQWFLGVLFPTIRPNPFTLSDPKPVDYSVYMTATKSE